MNEWVRYLWIIPALPLVAAAATSLVPRNRRRFAATVAIGALAVASVLALLAFLETVHGPERMPRVVNFRWFELGDTWVQLGWVLDPLTAVMLVMVSLVGLLIFIYSVGYMAHDENFTRFFCFLSLFAAAMLGLVIANSLLLFFICWELVGLTSFLLIGFWYHRPSAAAAAKKAFITTRIGDLAFLLGMVWLYAQTGTLLFYDQGQGCLEQSALASMATRTTAAGLLVSTGIGLLLFCGAIGKSGQVPLHVWLPDAMEGPTPVSALIHAATMVAAGVFLIARVYPLMAAHPIGASPDTAALQVVTWIGAVTAFFAATIAVAQTDIKRILAYSTVSQLGFMMLGLGTGGVAVGMFHLITHAFFKALLFMGAGSVIHGCHEEQDIRCMGGLRRLMPVTFTTYAVGMLALSGFPLLFSGFWSKDAILHAAHGWAISHWPFYLALAGALLTAFYMTRQVLFVFFGHSRSSSSHATRESPSVMTLPLSVLAAATLLLSIVGTPAWPWFDSFLQGEPVVIEPARLADAALLKVMALSTLIVFVGLGLGYWFYGRKPPGGPADPDVLQLRWPNLFELLTRKYLVDEIYELSIVRLNSWWARACDRFDRDILQGLVRLASWVVTALAWTNRMLDEAVVNSGFDRGCRDLVRGGSQLSRFQGGRVQSYLRVLAIGVTVLGLLLLWGCQSS